MTITNEGLDLFNGNLKLNFLMRLSAAEVQHEPRARVRFTPRPIGSLGICGEGLTVLTETNIATKQLNSYLVNAWLRNSVLINELLMVFLEICTR